MTDLTLVPEDALAGHRVALSVSESADLTRLGLTKMHLDLVVAELARAVLLSGGVVAYGGRLRPAGFTQVIMSEVRRYGDGRHALDLYVPEPEHRNMALDDLRAIDARLGTSGRLNLLSFDGEVLSISDIGEFAGPPDTTDDAIALSAMRRKVCQTADARIVVGGKLSDYAGSEPGVIEEVRLTLEARKPVYVSGGFGGAAAAVARVLGYDDFEWAPSGFPSGVEAPGVSEALERLGNTFMSCQIEDGLTSEERQILAVSHRPGDIASLAVRGMARAAES
ncbi:hypothetical protein [Mycobacterium asiaticum]|uniref:hypothetical protein n=1 Tax=Mycobacterium asiaticum TaxID=1790 RepID=UPI000B073D8F